MRTGRQVMHRLAENPRPALRGAAYHHCVRACFRQYEPRFLRRINVAIGNHWNRDGTLYLSDCLIFGLAGKAALPGAPVQRQGDDAAGLRQMRNLHGVSIRYIPAGPKLQGHRYVDRGDNRLENA